MAEKNLGKDKILCIIAMVLTVGGYGIERIIESFVTMTKTSASVLAMVFTAILAVVYFLISRSNDPFFGLLATLIGYKMLPPSISTLATYSMDVAVLYYVVQKVAIILFVLMLIKIYKAQTEEHKIRLIPLLAAIFVVPFFSEIASTLGGYFMSVFGGSMLYLYAMQFALYFISMLVILFASVNSNYSTLRFMTYFEYVALGINILKKASAILLNVIRGQHISLSYYVWILIFVVGIVLFAFAKKNAKKKQQEVQE